MFKYACALGALRQYYKSQLGLFSITKFFSPTTKLASLNLRAHLRRHGVLVARPSLGRISQATADVVTTWYESVFENEGDERAIRQPASRSQSS
ncbi:hypothetical protein N7527_008844 [Penicillium freii]|nr:hypothetical protein N7527_008844 [Penicillium freii]